jgi:hypothetical protein
MLTDAFLLLMCACLTGHAAADAAAGVLLSTQHEYSV